jgi:hypothetical protein
MRNSIPFDTHAFVKRLTAAGVPEAQAEVQAEALAEIALAQLATKDDLANMEQRQDSRFKELEARLDSRFKEVELRFKEVELRLTLRVGAMLAAAVGVIVALIKLL